MGGSPGLVVMVIGSFPRGREFESQYSKLDGSLFTFVLKNCIDT